MPKPTPADPRRTRLQDPMLTDAAALRGPWRLKPRIDSEARKKRDAQIRSMDERIAEDLEQSRRSGELQSAESYGKPMAEMAGYAETPPEFRMPFKILKNADAQPPEIDLFRRRATLRAQVAEAPPGPERRKLEIALSEAEQALAMRLEHLRVTGSL